MDILKFLNQTAVVWSYASPDGKGGFIFDSSPSEIRVRKSVDVGIWSDNVADKSISKTKLLAISEVKENDYIYLGKLSDVPFEYINDPIRLKIGRERARRVKRVSKTYEVKTDKVLLYKIYFDPGV